MARSDEAAAWFSAVYQAVQEIPHGKVTSYGHIAKLLGKRKLWQDAWLTLLTDHTGSEMSKVDTPSYLISPGTDSSRQVGVCLKHLPRDTDQPNTSYNSSTVPWQRVLNSRGVISPR
jgi:methylated-DNA-protein-cysteine methyltransferase-like protein